jgi:hypothetical protein
MISAPRLVPSAFSKMTSRRVPPVAAKSMPQWKSANYWPEPSEAPTMMFAATEPVGPAGM